MDFLLITENHGFPVIGTDRRPFQSRRKFPYGNFLPPEVKKSDTCSLFWHLHSKCY